jgi:hypothetical protein
VAQRDADEGGHQHLAVNGREERAQAHRAMLSRIAQIPGGRPGRTVDGLR